jgi:hypothetical protein
MQPRTYSFTNHFRQRFAERFGKKFGVDYNDSFALNVCISRLINQAKPNRSFINNTEYMVYIHERYGADRRFEFLCNEGVVFVISPNDYVHGRNIWAVITCLEEKFTNVVIHKKFKKKELAEMTEF